MSQGLPSVVEINGLTDLANLAAQRILRIQEFEDIGDAAGDGDRVGLLNDPVINVAAVAEHPVTEGVAAPSEYAGDIRPEGTRFQTHPATLLFQARGC